jgi:GTP-binding protein Era
VTRDEQDPPTGGTPGTKRNPATGRQQRPGKDEQIPAAGRQQRSRGGEQSAAAGRPQRSGSGEQGAATGRQRRSGMDERSPVTGGKRTGGGRQAPVPGGKQKMGLDGNLKPVTARRRPGGGGKPVAAKPSATTARKDPAAGGTQSPVAQQVARQPRGGEAAPQAQPRSGGGYRAGFACFVGRPNAGKSTLTNAIIGQKIAITSNKPQTTRHVIRAVLHRPEAQLVLVDTPGLHRPRTLLGERLNDLVRETWSETDVIGLCVPADEPIGRGDKFITGEIAGLKATVIAVVTKSDLVGKQALAEQLLAVSRLGEFADIVPVSAVAGEQIDTLVDVMTKYLPESSQLYPDDMLTDEPEHVLVAELVREAALEGVRDELPHSIAVTVEEMLAENGVTKIFANIYVERSSQKAIVIGAQASRLKDVGIRAREQVEALLGTRVYLDLHVKVAKDWQRDPRQLRKLGF